MRTHSALENQSIVHHNLSTVAIQLSNEIEFILDQVIPLSTFLLYTHSPAIVYTALELYIENLSQLGSTSHVHAKLKKILPKV